MRATEYLVSSTQQCAFVIACVACRHRAQVFAFFLRTRLCQSQLTSFVIMIIITNFVSSVSNFVMNGPRSSCEVSNWISFFQRFQKFYLFNHLNYFFLNCLRTFHKRLWHEQILSDNVGLIHYFVGSLLRKNKTYLDDELDIIFEIFEKKIFNLIPHTCF